MRLENVHTEADCREHEATPEGMERLDADSMLRHARVYFSVSWNRMVVLLLSGILFLVPSIKLHRRSRRLGY